LQDDGVLESVRGLGLSVSSTARRQCQAERTRLIRARLRLVLEEALHSGLDASEIESITQAEVAAVCRGRQKQ
jgi:GntR family transcriptional regulator